MRGFDLQKLRRLNHIDRFLPSPVVTHKFTFTPVFWDGWMDDTKPSVTYRLLTYRYELISLQTGNFIALYISFHRFGKYNEVDRDWSCLLLLRLDGVTCIMWLYE